MSERAPDAELTLRPRGPAWLAGVVAHLQARVVPGIGERVDGGLRCSTRIDGAPVVVEVVAPAAVAGVGGSPVVHVRAWGVPGAAAPSADACERFVRQLLGIRAHVADADRVLAADAVLGPLVARRPGLRIAGTAGAFETVARTVLGQQVTVGAGVALVGQLVEVLGEPLDVRVGAITRMFPAPAAVAAADLDFLRMPAARRAALRSVAAAVDGGTVDLSGRAAPDEVRAQLLAVPGIGPWTADYVALRGLGDRDAFPAGDVAVQRSAAALGLPDEPRALLRHAERWRPFRAHAAQHLWDALGTT